MKKNSFLSIGRFALVFFILFWAFSCNKQEVAADDTLAGSATEEQTESEPETEPDDYISPDNFNLVEMEFGASADAEESTKGGLSFSMIETSLDDEDESTRTALDGSGNITWEEGDKLLVYYYKGSSNYTEGTIKHGGASSSTLTARVNPSDKFYYAFYPSSGYTTSVTYEGNATYTYGAIDVTIPSTQTVTIPAGADNNFATCHMAVGKASKDDQQFVFFNVGSYLKLEVTNTTATQITLQSSNGENIVGKFTVPFTQDAQENIGIGIDDETMPTVTSGSSTVTVILPGGRTTPITVYIALLPNVSFDGFRIRYEYGDELVHPGYANARRNKDTDARQSRQMKRRRVLNINALDDRIHENWYAVPSGANSYSDIDDASHPEAGASWSTPLNLTGLVDLLAQRLSSTGQQIDLDAFDRAWALNGSTVHLAEGTYSLPASTSKEAFKMEWNSLGHYVKFALRGNYQVGAAAPDSLNHHTVLTPAVAGKGVVVMGNWTDITFDNLTFSGARLSSADYFALKVAAGVYGETIARVSSCLFTDNQQSSDNVGSACAIFKGNAYFTKCTFSGNSGYSGSALILRDFAGNVSLEKCKFTGNTARQDGGAIACLGPSRTCSLTDCCIYNNYAARGGAIHLYAGTLSLSQSGFYTNYATGTGEGMGGGVIYMQNGSSSTRGTATLTVSNCMFKGNYCEVNYEQWGGVLYAANSKCNQTFTNTVFQGNHTKNKAAVIYLDGPSFLKLNGCLFLGNQTRSHGIIQGVNSNLIYMNRVTFYDNHTTATTFNSWGLNLHTAAATICMHNVTALGNSSMCGTGETVYQSNSINTDGSMLATCCTFIDNTTYPLLRSNGSETCKASICNNILINTGGYAESWSWTFHQRMHDYKNDDGSYNTYNGGNNVVCNDTKAFNWMREGVNDKINKTVSDLGGSYSESLNWKTGNANDIYGVYSWPTSKFDALGFASETSSAVTTTMGSYFKVNLSTDFGISNVGSDFYNWLNGFSPKGWNVDGRNKSRNGLTDWWPGAYQGNGF